MALTVADVRKWLDNCQSQDEVVLRGALVDGTGIRVGDLTLGTDQGGPAGEDIEVVISWEPGSEIITCP